MQYRIRRNALSVQRHAGDHAALPDNRTMMQIAVLDITSRANVCTQTDIAVSSPIVFFLTVGVDPRLPAQMRKLLHPLRHQMQQLPGRPKMDKCRR